jgi:hypothetical protein
VWTKGICGQTKLREDYYRISSISIAPLFLECH